MRKKQIHFFVAGYIDEQLTFVAKKLGATKSELVRQAVFNLLEKHQKILEEGKNAKEKRKSTT